MTSGVGGELRGAEGAVPELRVAAVDGVHDDVATGRVPDLIAPFGLGRRDDRMVPDAASAGTH